MNIHGHLQKTSSVMSAHVVFVAFVAVLWFSADAFDEMSRLCNATKKTTHFAAGYFVVARPDCSSSEQKE